MHKNMDFKKPYYNIKCHKKHYRIGLKNKKMGNPSLIKELIINALYKTNKLKKNYSNKF